MEHVGTTSFRVDYDIDRVDIEPVDKPGQPGHGRTRCAQVAITYVCVELDGRRKTPLPLGLREALVKDHS